MTRPEAPPSETMLPGGDRAGRRHRLDPAEIAEAVPARGRPDDAVEGGERGPVPTPVTRVHRAARAWPTCPGPHPAHHVRRPDRVEESVAEGRSEADRSAYVADAARSPPAATSVVGGRVARSIARGRHLPPAERGIMLVDELEKARATYGRDVRRRRPGFAPPAARLGDRRSRSRGERQRHRSAAPGARAGRWHVDLGRWSVLEPRGDCRPSPKGPPQHGLWSGGGVVEGHECRGTPQASDPC